MKYLGEDIGKLGFGFMRLPEKDDGSLDYVPMIELVDAFLDEGFTYFDTAYVYNGSEAALREALVSRHPRDSFTIATKLPTFMINKAEDMRETFETSLRRLGTERIDYYLFHGLSLEQCDKLERLGAWEFARALKDEGRIGHCGFSFHDTPENLDTILTRHPETEFVQLQINYLDWEDEKVRSRELYETVRRHDKPFVIMEPVKGGLLAGAGSQAEELLRAANPDVSEASWAVRFAASLDGLVTMLSGMNTMAQLRDNIATIKSLKPLSESELATLREVVKVINSVPRIPCTGCKYCVDNCPQKLNIPFLMHIYNDFLAYRQKVGSGMPFLEATAGGRFPSTCIGCRSCEEHCPQHIEISDIMPRIAKEFE
ncbi:MAG: aldo/keto reductase [Oscillospiraceae bacterium]|jgi:predicted aldo/keto reductase-like oxidoreductase|nr:aldo/keto reductase [Oscillospiraceae bacterium]